MNELTANLREALQGRYTVEREIARGRVSSVYLATDERHGRQVAVKVYHPEFAGCLGCDRFLTEAQITASLQHPHILPLLDSGTADGLPYYVMPFVEGESLRERLMRERQLPLDVAVRIAREVADALDYAHSEGVIHRDVKPENILLSDDHAVVADFGIARAIRAAGGDPWRDGPGSTGTAAYMSPEQIEERGEPNPRWDVYSLGATLYEMLAGRPPFVGPSAENIIRQHVDSEAPPIQRYRSTTPRELATVVHRALAKNPADRFATAGALAEALPSDPVPVPVVAAAGAKESAGETQRPGVVAGLLAVIAVLLVLFAWRLSTASGPIAIPATDEAAPAAVEDRGSIAVLPFTSLGTSDAETRFAEGLRAEINAQLAGLAGLRVVSRRAVAALPDSVVRLPEIGRTLSAGHLIDGSVRRSDGRLRVTVELVDAATGTQRWADAFDGAGATDPVELQTRVAAAVVDALTRLLPAAGDG